MSSILILYASSHGTTSRIAHAIAAQLRRDGHHVDVHDARGGALPVPDGYDAVVIGSRVHGGRHARCVRRYVEQHRDALRDVRGFFFSVSMGAAGGGKDPALAQFLQRSGWQPRLAVSFAGALPYTRYNPLLRFVMKHISRKAGHTTDTSRDHDFTDWRAVDAFADAIAERLSPGIIAFPQREDGPLPPDASILG